MDFAGQNQVLISCSDGEHRSSKGGNEVGIGGRNPCCPNSGVHCKAQLCE